MGKKKKQQISQTQQPQVVHPTSMNTTMIGSCEIICKIDDTHERTELMKQNEQLLKDKADLQLQLSISNALLKDTRETLNSKEITIAIIKEENAQLRKEIKLLEAKVTELQNSNDALNKDRMYRKLISAIQDTNGIFELEKKIDSCFLPCLMDFRGNRNADFHYIMYSRNPKNTKCKVDPPEVTKYKSDVLLDMLNKPQMLDHVKNIDDTFGVGLIAEIKKVLKNELRKLNVNEPTDIVKNEIINYWK